MPLFQHAVTLVAALSVPLAAAAQAPVPALPEAELRAACIPAGEGGLALRAPDCEVRSFGKVADIDGVETWYALYSNFPEPRAEAATGSKLDFANVLVLFAAPSGSAELSPFHIRNSEGSFYNAFDAPSLVATTIGTVLHTTGSGAGDGRSQFEYDLFLLWKDGAWVELNALPWIQETRQRLPPEYQLDGIYKDRFDLANLRYEGPVRRPEDAHLSATGGSVSVTLQLRGTDLVLEDFRYTP